MTLTGRPFCSTVVCNSQHVVTPEELALEVNDLLPIIEFAVALFPFPVFPIKTTLVLDSTSTKPPPIIKLKTK